MLVLARKSKETIQIGDQITISILRIKGNSVRVGIEAPGNVRVIRGEIAASDGEPADRGGRNRGPLAPSMDEVGTGSVEQPAATFQPSRRLSTQRVNQIMALRRKDRIRNSDEALVAS
jgi:carbon storage regulator